DTEFFPQKLAFTCGFLTHFAMDINFHPWVYYLSGNYFDPKPEAQLDAQMRHRIIESWLDLHILDGMPVQSFPKLEQISSNRQTNLKLLSFLAQACQRAWQVDKDLFYSLKRGYNLQMLMTASLFKSNAFREIAITLNDILENRLRGYLALFYPESARDIPRE